VEKPIEQLINSLESDTASFKRQFGLIRQEVSETQKNLACLGLIDIIRARMAARRKEFKAIAEELSKVKL
jgi:ribosome-interacting GTPase 1